MRRAFKDIIKPGIVKWVLIITMVLSFLYLGFAYSSTLSDKQGRKGDLNEQQLKLDIMSIPNFCGHEHWGSINAVGGYKPEYNGYYNDIYPGASPQIQTSIWDLVLEPYFEGMLRNAGINLTTGINAAGYTSLKLWWKAKPEAALEYFKTNVEPLLMNGTIQCTIKGIEKLYSVQLMSFDLNEWQKADSLVCSNYTGIFSWYQKVMLKANFSGLIRHAARILFSKRI